ncbi:MAG TPA: tetratricopeptide repeat protein [Solirubrobacteraceae bacterium]|nr:tetratricopeptide repeat protein [Solirubrobacteraceae bacterium]
MTCAQPDCTGEIVDGYCDVCGMAPKRATGSAPLASTRLASSGTAVTGRRPGTRRTTARSRLGAGLVEVPPTPYRDPATAVLEDPGVAETRRFCGRCGEPVGRSRDGAPGRTEGFCRSCGAHYSFAPKLAAGDNVGQYEVVGCLAHGGMGWVYLAKDHNVSDRWVVLKGLLNTGDDDAMAAALAERRFLAEVEHPNIVKIHNFVQHDSSGYIVMEYVGGTSLKDILRARRQAQGGTPQPLPPAQAIAYILEVLPALGYLHGRDLLFCDFKLDNVIQTEHSLKLIDLGGVYRMGDASSPIYGTVGYQAPEIAQTGPSIPSDLFTVARTLAVLCFDFSGYQGQFKFTLPPQDTVPLFQRFDSLYRFLTKATAPDPDDRFQSAEEMAGQLFGVLREVVAAEDGTTVAAQSTLFTEDLRADPARPAWERLPALRVAADDPAAGFLATVTATEPSELVAKLEAAPVRTVDVELRLVRALMDAGEWRAARELCDVIEQENPWEWRAAWARGVCYLAQGRADGAVPAFTDVYAAVPGELAPKLALGVAFELGGSAQHALPWYETVARTDPSYTTAAFGLARCRLRTGDRGGALDAYAAVPASSSAHDDAQVAKVQQLAATNDGSPPKLADLRTAEATLQSLSLDPERRAGLTVQVLNAALALVGNGTAPDEQLLGVALTERDLRSGIERGYRTLAHHTEDAGERIRLVDRANAVRPRTWT